MPSNQNFTRFCLHLWKFSIHLNLRTNFISPTLPQRTREGWGNRMESESLEEEAIGIGNS